MLKDCAQAHRYVPCQRTSGVHPLQALSKRKAKSGKLRLAATVEHYRQSPSNVNQGLQTDSTRAGCANFQSVAEDQANQSRWGRGQ